MDKIRIIVICSTIFYSLINYSQPLNTQDSLIIDAALVQTDLYFDLIENKRIALVVNQGSYVDNTHIVDTLINLNIDVVSIFSPEHGFKGDIEAGQKIENNLYKDIPIFSLYGKSKKPSKSSFGNVDLVLFDLQDVGVRFYTYISTLHYVMEACAEYKVPLIILDRYNPNIYHIDGPVLNKDFSSFVGMHPVPVIYGMTIGEYALMINGERWLNDSLICDLDIIPLSENHINNNNKYFKSTENFCLKRPPSPNLKTTKSIKSYPTLCFFEGTPISIGRGTDYPFEIIGSSFFSFEDFYNYNRSISDNNIFIFVPKSRKESVSPKFENQKCAGFFYDYNFEENMIWKINLTALINIYNIYSEDKPFFNSFFRKLAGNSQLELKIQDAWDEKEIRDSWSKDLKLFQDVRKKYLIYPRTF